MYILRYLIYIYTFMIYIYIYTHTHTHTHIRTYIYLGVEEAEADLPPLALDLSAPLVRLLRHAHPAQPQRHAP